MQDKGQLSLEYLLVLLVFLALLGMVAPLVTQTYQRGLEALSLKQAELFADRLDSALEQLGLFSAGSRRELKVNPPTPWRLEGQGHGFQLTLGEGEKEIVIERETASPLTEFDLLLEGRSGLRLDNDDGEITLQLMTEAS